MNIDIRYYLAVFLRRLPIFLVIFLAVTATGVWFATVLPPKYRAQAELLVESPQIPDELASSTVETGGTETLRILQQRLMTRANLLEIARKFEVLNPDEGLSPDKIVAHMRSRTEFTFEGGGRSRDAQSNFMTISFTAESPSVSAEVVNEYVTRLLQANIEMRQGRAGQTLEFFEQQVQQLDEELALQSDRIVAFKSANADALPADAPFRLARQAQLEERISQMQRDVSMLADQRKRLVEVYETTGQISAQNVPLTPEQSQLQELKRELNSALAVYSAENPRVRFLRARVQQLETTLAENPSEEDGTDPGNAVLELQLAELDARRLSLEQQIAIAEAEVKELREQIARTQPNIITLDSLQRDYENLQSQYNAAVSNLAAAATGERIELLSKGERITVLEQAIAPNEPTSPDRPKIMAAGALAGAGLGGGLVVLMELLNQAIRRPIEIQNRLGIAPLVTLPYVRTRRELFWKRLFWLSMILVAVLGVPAVLWAVHTFFIPFDLLLERVRAELPF